MRSLTCLLLVVGCAPTVFAQESTMKLGTTASWTRWSAERARQFGTMGTGLTLEELRYFDPARGGKSFAQFAIRDLPDRDHWMGGTLILPGGRTQLSINSSLRRYKLSGAAKPSSDRVTYFAASHSLGKSGLFLTYDDSMRRVNPEHQSLATRQRTQQIVAGFQSPQFALTAGQTRYAEA
ncbi:MAG: hypothetical protein ABL962_12920, partial [Fimbriimonadaceae bacterium]